MKMFRKDEGFTLVELMVVVLIIGILVAIAIPVFLNASANAQAKSCQANQRTIVGAINTAVANQIFTVAPDTKALSLASDNSAMQAGTLSTTGAWGTALVPNYIKAIPHCPLFPSADYSIGTTGGVTSDGQTGGGFPANHQL